MVRKDNFLTNVIHTCYSVVFFNGAHINSLNLGKNIVMNIAVNIFDSKSKLIVYPAPPLDIIIYLINILIYSKPKNVRPILLIVNIPKPAPICA